MEGWKSGEMNYYLIPGTGIYGGIKVAAGFAEALNRLGAPCCLATPDGTAPAWFQASVATVSHDTALASARVSDNILFSLPHDYPKLKSTAARLVFHCQGTDPLIDPILADPNVALLSCWPQATTYMHDKSGRNPIEVGLSISPCFFYDGAPKLHGTVAFMPRRGRDIAAACQAALPNLRFVPVKDATEADVARVMKSSEYYLATAVNEWFGLPAFEAMAAGCVVLSVPVLGGMDYLRNDSNALVVEPEQLPARLAWISADERHDIRARLRDHAVATAHLFRPAEFHRRLTTLLKSELSYLQT